MRLGKRGVGVLVGLVAVGISGWMVFARYWFYLPGIIAQIRDPIGPSREVVWAKGPDTAEVPVEKRPPNIILILADDLGYNDLTFGGGGVAGGAVVTPNIDSIARDGALPRLEGRLRVPTKRC